jgi:exopolysaccharide biosynthesis predicted pyruvyltransferase EpsI
VALTASSATERPSTNLDWQGHIETVAQRATRTLAEVVAPRSTCAVLDHPDHPNVGDSAIWLGERVFLRQNRNRISYSCCVHTFDEAALRRAMPRGTVLIHGGGNFGTLWPRHQALREQALAQLKDYRIVQLPQSIRYEDDGALRHTVALIAAHPDFHLLTRDAASFEFARDQLRARALMCPDSALLLAGRLKRDVPVVDCLVLARTDKERAFDNIQSAFIDSHLSVETADWLDEPVSRLHRLRDRFQYATRRPLASSRLFQASRLAIWDRLATERTQRGCSLLSRGRIVVTDRLHAHILSTLLGIPHIVLDNNYGKLSGFIKAWTHDNPLCHLASSVDEAVTIARGLLRAAR